MKVDVSKELQIACVDLVRELPYYGYMLMQMPKVLDDSVGTLAVAKRPEELLVKLMVSPSYVQSIYEDKDVNTRSRADRHLLEVLKHEMLHICFYHLSSFLPDRHRQTVACELEANSYINRALLLDGQKGLFPEDFHLPAKKNMLWYYDNLPSSKEYQEMASKDRSAAAMAVLSIQGKDASGQLDSHSTWEETAKDPAISDALKDLVKKAVDMHCDSGGDPGSVPGSMLDAISAELHPPVIPWKRVLRNFVASSSESELGFTLRRKSRRFGTRPGSFKIDVLRCLVGIDTSGSIDNSQLSRFFSELKWLSKEGNITIDVAECDTKINRVYPFSRFDGNVEGRGGTSLEPLLKYASEGRYDCLICFTDFYSSLISGQYSVPCLWCISGGSRFFEHPEERCYKKGIFIDIDRSMGR